MRQTVAGLVAAVLVLSPLYATAVPAIDEVRTQASSARAGAGRGLLIADLHGRRLLITDLRGEVIWEFRNPTGSDSAAAGPLGVRWRKSGKILATFGTGEVGQIDVATKTWDWQVTGFRGDYFESPYDAQLLPRGKLAVATRYDEGGRVAVYDRSSGKRVWRHRIAQAHTVVHRRADKSRRSKSPTLITGGFGAVREVTYRPGRRKRVVWRLEAGDVHDVVPLPRGRFLVSEDTSIRKVARSGRTLWRRQTPGLAKRFAPRPGGGFVVSVAESDELQFRSRRGRIERRLSALGDGSSLDYPYGIRLIDLDQVPAS